MPAASVVTVAITPLAPTSANSAPATVNEGSLEDLWTVTKRGIGATSKVALMAAVVAVTMRCTPEAPSHSRWTPGLVAAPVTTAPSGRSGSDGTALVDVSDTGAGIAAEARERIFDRFYRGDEVATVGTGLGLSIAKSAVEAHGGELSIERSDAGGTTFRIRLSKS